MKTYETLKQEKYVKLEYEKYSIIYNYAPNGYFTINPDSEILEMNYTGAKMLGLDSNDLLKVNIKNHITNDTLAIYNSFLEKVFETHIKQTCRISFDCQGIPQIHAHIEGTNFENKNECLITATDVSDIDMLEKSEVRYRTLFESSKDGILILDTDSSRIIDVNPVLTEMIEFSHDRLLGKEIWNVSIFKNIVCSREAFEDLQDKEKNIHYSLEKISGKILEVEIVSNVYQMFNKREIQCNIRDVTERQRHEKEMEDTKTRLEELNAAKDKFFSIISHDLRSPFNSIIGYSELLASKIDRKDYAGIEEYAKTIQQSSWRAMDLLSNLMEWSRSESGRMEFKHENIEIEPFINEVLKNTIDAANRKEINIIKVIPNKTFVFADNAMLSTVLRNLISNAIKFTVHGGKIIVSVEKTERDILFSVCDNGIGMEQKILNNLFKIEECASSKGTAEEKGTGLGLVLCKEFVSRHNGMIWVEGELGRGSSFHFTIPESGFQS